MKIDIVIPAHNESENIRFTLDSLVSQSLLPQRIVVVDDHSTDDTADIVESYVSKFSFISLVRGISSAAHLPGSKVIHAFYRGYESLTGEHDIICKFDADLIFPPDYLEKIISLFQKDSRVGMAGGFCQVRQKDQWVLENLTGKDHIRGAIKAYKKECFLEIGKLKPSMGWDTVDELLAQYHGWKIITDENLLVKHLKPTGKVYSKEAKLKQGEAFYKLRYGFAITLIASVKLAMKKRDPKLVFHYLQGYRNAKTSNLPFLVSEKEGAFIRRLRYKKMLQKIF